MEKDTSLEISRAYLVNEDNRLVLKVDATSRTGGWSDVRLEIQPDSINHTLREFKVILRGEKPKSNTTDALQDYNLSVDIPDRTSTRLIEVLEYDGSLFKAINIAVVKQRDIGTDYFDISKASIEGNKAIVDVSYSGDGQQEHDFQLSWDETDRTQFPALVSLILSHNANGDNRRALINETLEFDLTACTIDAPEVSPNEPNPFKGQKVKILYNRGVFDVENPHFEHTPDPAKS